MIERRITYVDQHVVEELRLGREHLVRLGQGSLASTVLTNDDSQYNKRRALMDNCCDCCDVGVHTQVLLDMRNGNCRSHGNHMMGQMVLNTLYVLHLDLIESYRIIR